MTASGSCQLSLVSTCDGLISGVQFKSVKLTVGAAWQLLRAVLLQVWPSGMDLQVGIMKPDPIDFIVFHYVRLEYVVCIRACKCN